ncbi:MAG: GNAT family N-acetyltransferase [Candidatus Uhrbacteria bacterium]
MKNTSPETTREFPEELKIETTETQDIPRVQQIAEMVKLDPKNPDQEKLNKGFLIYTLSDKQYSIRLNDYFTVARKENGDTVGFLMCYDTAFLRRLIASGEIAHEDGIMNFLQTTEPNGNYIFGDQIGVDYSQSNKGVGRKLLKDLFAKMKAKGIEKMYVAVLSKPVENLVSKNFCKNLGAKKVSEVENNDGLGWSIYKFEVE